MFQERKEHKKSQERKMYDEKVRLTDKYNEENVVTVNKLDVE